ncbi:MAG: tetratricopeptide repeat protein [Deltaproteobacteria bacterium]|nr:tetratricopeptide repeat protein [Deltaproteobacteria bacterium]
MGCLNEETVVAFVSGRLSEDDVSKVEDHIDRCPDCRKVVANLIDSSLVRPVEPSATDVDRSIATRVDGSGQRRRDASEPPPSRSAESLAQGATAGRYLVLRAIGAGGMGVVYAAWDPELDRKVAIKVLRTEMLAGDLDDARRRMVREAQAMAKLRHPNVVTVHDVGDVDGQVFVAMEFVHGRTFKQWLAESQRSVRDVLSILVPAGHGLAAAHRAGLVHRDFKPDNVLVGWDDVVRVTDFGLARAVEGSLPPPSEKIAAAHSAAIRSTVTQVGTVVGTPRYMSPEQKAGRKVDARGDQYSFCVTLQEAIAKTGATPPRWLQRVISKGTQELAENRYESMDAVLAELEGRPGRWMRRALVVAAVIITAVALFGSYHRGRGSVRATCSDVPRRIESGWDASTRAKVRQRFEATGKPWARQTWASVDREMSAYAADWTTQAQQACEETRVRRERSEVLLDLRQECLDRKQQEFSALGRLLAESDEPLMIHATHAVAALPPVRECLDTAALVSQLEPLRDAALRKRHAEIVEHLSEARALDTAGKIDEALQRMSAVVAEARALGYRPLEAETLFELGDLQDRSGHGKDAEATLFQAAAAATVSRHDRVAALAWVGLVHVIGYANARYDEALRAAIQAQSFVERVGAPASLRLALSVSIANVHLGQARYQEASREYDVALQLAQGAAQSDDLEVARIIDNLASSHFEQGHLDEARRLHERAKAIREKMLGADHPDMADSLDALAGVDWAEGKFDSAIAAYDRALEVRKNAFGPDSLPVAQTISNQGVVLLERGSFGEAEQKLRAALPTLIASLGSDHPDVARMRMNLGLALARSGRRAEAETLLVDAADAFEKALGGDHIDVAMALYSLAELRRLERKPGEALKLYARSLAIVEKTMGPEFRGAAHVLTGIGLTLLAQGRSADAIAPLTRALPLREGDRIAVDLVAETRFALARALWESGNDRSRAIELATGASEELARGTMVTRNDSAADVKRWLGTRR